MRALRLALCVLLLAARPDGGRPRGDPLLREFYRLLTPAGTWINPTLTPKLRTHLIAAGDSLFVQIVLGYATTDADSVIGWAVRDNRAADGTGSLPFRARVDVASPMLSYTSPIPLPFEGWKWTACFVVTRANERSGVACAPLVWVVRPDSTQHVELHDGSPTGPPPFDLREWIES